MRFSRLLALCPLALIALLSACGGGSSGGGTGVSSIPSSSVSSSSPSSESSSSSSSVTTSVCGVTGGDFKATEVLALPEVKCILVDQFGYLPGAAKVAVLKNPEQGFDNHWHYSPGDNLAVVHTTLGEVVFSSGAQRWNQGAVHAISGDRAWQLDFSSITAAGEYVVVDTEQGVRSPVFRIEANVYREVWMQAVRTFFYQRAGFAKQTPYAEPGWVDGASHLGARQDTQARLYNAVDDATTERDLRGGWYDAGDYNKYTNWHAEYLVAMLQMYRENPAIWTDDFNLPESGNGLPDLVDEILWGMDWLIRMQEKDGSLLSVMGLAHGSPPSTAEGPSVYGPATTAATFSGAAAFALGAQVLGEFESLRGYAEDLLQRAKQAWQWAEAHPQVTFYNSANGVAAGEQEVDDSGRATKKLTAAVYLFAASGEPAYQSFVDANVPAIAWVGPWNQKELRTLLYYSDLDTATASVANSIRQQYVSAMEGNWGLQTNDPYRAYLGAQDFTWGSNRTMSYQGLSFSNVETYDLSSPRRAEVGNRALGYLHYLHGVNPLGKVYLSNMGDYGAEDSVDRFYHSWFSHGSPDWDSVSESNFGPAPGFLVGGPNPSYSWDACCPTSCGSSANNAMCGPAPLAPPANQPAAKAYKDFNDNWPVNSWAVTENHNDYQVAYLLLLSRFVQ